jgi:hypothetical protein
MSLLVCGYCTQCLLTSLAYTLLVAAHNNQQQHEDDSSMVLLVLDGLDSELEHSKHCRDAVVRVLDALLRGDAGLRLLLTCEHSLLFNSSERLSNALEWGVLVDVSHYY